MKELRERLEKRVESIRLHEIGGTLISQVISNQSLIMQSLVEIMKKLEEPSIETKK